MTSSPTPGFDARQFKRIERDGYNLIGARYGAAAAARQAIADALLDAVQLQPGLHALDLASGPGLLARAAAARIGAAGYCVASDIAEGQLAHCTDLPRIAADGEHLPFRAAAFDRVLCGLGLMIFPEPQRALREALRVLAPGGRIALSVWGAGPRVPLVACALDCMRRLLPAPKVARPSIFRFGDSALLAETLREAGYADVAVNAVRFTSSFASAAEYWQSFLDLAGGAAGSLARLPAARQAELAAAVTQELEPYAVTGGYRMESEVLVAAAARV